MKAILLAAGKGTRISRMVEEVPKSTLPIAGIPLIRLTVEMLLEENIEPIVCIGYKKEKIYKALEGLPVRYYYNPFYNITNSIASLWFAKQELIKEDVLILNADVYFSKEILSIVLKNEWDNVLAIDKTRVTVGDYFFATNDNGCIHKYGKDLPLEERSCEYVGIAKITKEFLPVFLKRMCDMIDAGQHQCWWENILYSFTDKAEQPIHTADVEGRFWSEIDYFDDYERILNHIKEKD